MLLSFLKLYFVWFLICKWKLLMVFNFIIGGGGNIVMKVFLMLLYLMLSFVVIVFVDMEGLVCLLKLDNIINIMLLLVVLVNLFIFSFGNLRVVFIFGCVRVIVFIFFIIWLFLFSEVVFGN